MKKITSILLSASMIFTLAACGGQTRAETAPAAQPSGETAAEESTPAESQAQPSPAPSQAESGSDPVAADTAPGAGKTLVVYYSATGHTDAVAGYIAEALGGDLFKLEPVEPYGSRDLDWRDADSRVSREHENPGLRAVDLTAATVDGWDSYSNVFVGYPIWWGIAAWPVDGFIAANDFTGKTVVPFCTSSSSGLGDSGKLLAEAAGTGNWLEGQRFSSGASKEEVQAWAEGLELQGSVQASVPGAAGPAGGQTASKVYFTSDISPEGLMAVYKALEWAPEGKVAVKLSTGEPPASNYLDPGLIKDLVQSVDASIVECNTAYGGSRAETAMHRQVAEDHGFTAIAQVDILDEDGSMELPVAGGTRLTTNLVGSHFSNYDSYIILSHFKGHAMAGFGGAVKNISIGLGSKEGKCLIHTAGQSSTSPWGGDQTGFTESMAEAGKSVSDYLGNGQRIVYVNVLNNISIDCDCNGNPAQPDIHDIGIVASLDPVAIDQACIDLAFAAEGSETLQARVNDRNGLHTLEHGEAIGLGSRSYELIEIDQ